MYDTSKPINELEAPLHDGLHHRESKKGCNFLQGLQLLLLMSAVGLLIAVTIFVVRIDKRGIDANTISATSKNDLHCSLAIVGGGISGLYAAEYLQRNNIERSVCVFEASDRLGGRIADHFFQLAPSVSAGMGAWRIHLEHENMMNLVARFNLTMGPWDFNKVDKYEARGVFTNSTDELKQAAFPTLMKGRWANMTADDMWAYILSNTSLARADQYTDFGSYIKGELSPEAWDFMGAGVAYRADLLEVDTKTYAEFYNLDKADVSGHVIRPTSGMSEFIRRLKVSAEAVGARIYTKQPVTRIGLYDDKTPDFLYQIETNSYMVSAQKLMLAIPPDQLGRIEGSVIETITQQDEFKSIQSQPAMKGAAVYSEAWWLKSPEARSRLLDMQRYLTTSVCLGLVVPYEGRGPNSEAVLHTIFATGQCAQHWANIFNEEKSKLDKAVQQQLTYLFPDISVPPALDTTYQYWPDGAWHFQNPDFGFDLEDIEAFAVNPVKAPAQTGTLFLVGEAFNRRRTWCEGALRSVNNVLREVYHVDIHDK